MKMRETSRVQDKKPIVNNNLEAILPRRDADKWRQGKGKSDTPQISIIMNGTIMREEADLDRFAEKLVRKLNEQKIITQ